MTNAWVSPRVNVTLPWLRGKGVVFARLVASEQAKQAGLYEKLGFSFSNEMRLRLDAPAP